MYLTQNEARRNSIEARIKNLEDDIWIAQEKLKRQGKNKNRYPLTEKIRRKKFLIKKLEQDLEAVEFEIQQDRMRSVFGG